MDYNEILKYPIEDNEFNRKLKRLYKTVFTKKVICDIESYNSNPDTDPSTIIVNPQLITMSKSFMDSQCRIIHFGDETNGWGGEDPVRKGAFNPDLIPDFLMRLYGKYGANHIGDRNWKYCDMIKRQFPHVGIIHMNTLLMGYPRGCRGGYAEMNYKINEITKGILNIAHPHLCIFHTGGKNEFQEYDNHIKKMIGNFEIQDELRGENNRLLASTLNFINPPFKFFAIRTHHLNNRNFSTSQKDMVQMRIEEMINRISTNGIK